MLVMLSRSKVNEVIFELHYSETEVSSLRRVREAEAHLVHVVAPEDVGIVVIF